MIPSNIRTPINAINSSLVNDRLVKISYRFFFSNFLDSAYARVQERVLSIAQSSKKTAQIERAHTHHHLHHLVYEAQAHKVGTSHPLLDTIFLTIAFQPMCLPLSPPCPQPPPRPRPPPCPQPPPRPRPPRCPRPPPRPRPPPHP